MSFYNETSLPAVTDFLSNKLVVYQDKVGSTPLLTLGSGDGEKLTIQSTYTSGTKNLEKVDFTTTTNSSSSHDGRMIFNVDSIKILEINDSGLMVTGTNNISSNLNIQGRLNVSNTSFFKTTNIAGNLSVIGSVNLGSTLKLSGDYLNFGTQSGTSGYGFKNNSGTIQFKNSGGSWTSFSGSGGGITNITSDDNFTNINSHVNITGKLNIGGTLSVGGDLNVSGNTTYSLKDGTRHLFGMNTKGFNAVQQQKLTASDGASNDYFGVSVSLYNDYAVIGASGFSSGKGSVYIFKYNGSTWIQQAKLTASDGASNDKFGYSVSLYEDYALIGAYGNDDNGSASGSAYIFKRNGSTWNQQQKLTASDGSNNDQFGASVSLYKDYALIGAEGDNSAKGSAYIFKRNASTWNQQQKLLASDGAGNDYFGISVSIYKDYSLVGASLDDSQKGSAYIFKRNGSTWTQQAKLTASDRAINDYFGNAVSLYKDYAVVAAHQEGEYIHGSVNDETGAVYIFKRTGSNWSQMAKLKSNDKRAVNFGSHQYGDFFGNSVSLFDNYVIIGAFGKEPTSQAITADFGACYIFKRNGEDWIQIKKIVSNDRDQYDRFGSSVSFYNHKVLIGAYEQGNGGNGVGSSYVFDITEDTLLLDNIGTTIASFVSGSKMGIGTNNPDYKLHIEDYEPQLALKSTNDSHQEASCRSEILFKDHNNYCLSKILGQHEGSGDDSKGALFFYTNPNLSYSLGLGMKIDNDQMTHMYGNVNISGSVNIKDSLKIEKSLSVGEKSYLSNVNIQGNLSVLGSVNIGGSLNIGNKVYISDGHISAEVKSFLIDHPIIKGKKLRHGCLEGPQHGIYIRDTCFSNTKSFKVDIPDYFIALCGNDYNLTLTSHCSGHLYIKEKNKNNFIVESNKESYGFEYLIVGCRESINIIE